VTSAAPVRRRRNDRPACGDSPGNGSFVAAGGAHVPSTSITVRVGSPPATTYAPPRRQAGRATAGQAGQAGVRGPLAAWGPPPAGLDWPDVACIPELASARQRVAALVLCLVLVGVSLVVALTLSAAPGLVPMAPPWSEIAPLIQSGC
jgi:hypothetical protein